MFPLTLVLWVDDVTLRTAPTPFFGPTLFLAFHLFHVYMRMRVCVVAVLLQLMGSSARRWCYALSFCILFFVLRFVSAHPPVCTR